MSKKNQKAIPPVLERFELKYTIPFEMVEPISNFVSLYAYLDKYSERAEAGFYKINNLYFDTPDYLLLKKRQAESDNRFNMRIRSYGDNPKPPYFLEIKHKMGDILRKYRYPVNSEDLNSFILKHKYSYESHEALNAEECDESQKRNRDIFFRLMRTYNAEPKLLTQYVRKAWISDIDDYARVTFDIDLRYMPEDRYNVLPDESMMVNYDNEVLFDPYCSVILELKCYASSVPLWMIDLIQRFDLRRRGFSKYMSGALELFDRYSYDSGIYGSSLFL